jgi:hypothetical protein
MFGTFLNCLTKIQIKFKFGFDPLIFHDAGWYALGLGKYYELSVFSTFLVPPTSFAVSESYKSKSKANLLHFNWFRFRFKVSN